MDNNELEVIKPVLYESRSNRKSLDNILDSFDIELIAKELYERSEKENSDATELSGRRGNRTRIKFVVENSSYEDCDYEDSLSESELLQRKNTTTDRESIHNRSSGRRGRRIRPKLISDGDESSYSEVDEEMARALELEMIKMLVEMERTKERSTNLDRIELLLSAADGNSSVTSEHGTQLNFDNACLEVKAMLEELRAFVMAKKEECATTSAESAQPKCSITVIAQPTANLLRELTENHMSQSSQIHLKLPDFVSLELCESDLVSRNETELWEIMKKGEDLVVTSSRPQHESSNKETRIKIPAVGIDEAPIKPRRIGIIMNKSPITPRRVGILSKESPIKPRRVGMISKESPIKPQSIGNNSH